MVKTVVLLANVGSSNEYPLINDTIMCYAEVDFLSKDDEQVVRNKIVGAFKTQIPLHRMISNLLKSSTKESLLLL